MSSAEEEAAPKRRRGRPPSAARARQSQDGAGEQRVEAVERALTILEAFSDSRPRLSLAELTERTGFYPSTILRLAASLDRFGYLHQDENGYFRLGPTPLRLGVIYRNSFDLASYVRPALARLVEKTGETAAFYIREGDQRICLYRHHSPRLIRHHIEEGMALPMDRGASARVLMAFTGGNEPLHEEIRARGFYFSQGERDPETAAIAAPVFGHLQTFIGSLGITGLANRFSEENCERLAALLVDEARLLSRVIGGR